MVVTTLTVSGLDITVEPFPGIKPQLHEPVPGKRNDVQYLRLSRGKRAVYILPDMNAAVTGGGKRITLGGGTSRLFIIEPGSQGGAAKVKRVAANASVAEDPDSRDKHGDAASVFSARTSIYLRRADFGEDGLYSDLAKYCFRAARNLRAKTGGIRCSEQNWFCDAGSMSDYLHFGKRFRTETACRRHCRYVLPHDEGKRQIPAAVFTGRKKGRNAVQRHLAFGTCGDPLTVPV